MSWQRSSRRARRSASRAAVGGPAGSIPGVAASDVVQAGLDHRAADAPEAVAGTGHSAAHLWETACCERPYCPMGAGGSSEGASRNGMTVLVRSGEKNRS
jgi:hypothetical protein